MNSSSDIIAAKSLTEVFKAKWLDLRGHQHRTQRSGEFPIQLYRTIVGTLQACCASVMMGLAAYLTVQQMTTAGVIFASGFLFRPPLQVAQAIPEAILSWRRSRLAKLALKSKP